MSAGQNYRYRAHRTAEESVGEYLYVPLVMWCVVLLSVETVRGDSVSVSKESYNIHDSVCVLFQEKLYSFMGDIAYRWINDSNISLFCPQL